MSPLNRLSIVEQTANHLRLGFQEGRWQGQLPGVRQLASELGVCKSTICAALLTIEAEGLLVAAPDGRRRLIVEPTGSPHATRKMRIGILLRDSLEGENAPNMRVIMGLWRDLEAAGHLCVFPSKSQRELQHDHRRIRRMVQQTPVDAWIILFSSQELLAWFAQQPIPVFALGGHFTGLPIAAVDCPTDSLLHEATRQLLALGHRRIVFLAPGFLRYPQWRGCVSSFAAAMAELGIAADHFHVPNWEETPEGLQNILESLFRITPPTALIATEPAHVNGIMTFLMKHGLQIPRDVSLIVQLSSGSLDWCRPAPAHFRPQYDAITREVTGWVEGLARGKPHRQQKSLPREWVAGESIAPPLASSKTSARHTF